MALMSGQKIQSESIREIGVIRGGILLSASEPSSPNQSVKSVLSVVKKL